MFGSPSKPAEQLIDIYARMIFMHGHVHCDAHPGNLMVRKTAKGNPEIVLLDHGSYCSTGEQFRKDFCELWYSLALMDYDSTELIAKRMGLGEYYRYLPLLFTYRTINSTKPLGGRLDPVEKEYFKSEKEIDLDRIGMLLQKLPTDLVFIFKAMHMVGVHNARYGGSTRQRLLNFTEYAC